MRQLAFAAAALAAEPGGEAHLEDFAGELKALEKTLTGPGDLVAAARIGSACDCDAGEPLWRYRPTRETFAFERIEGALGRYELRCDATREYSDVRPGETYSVPANGTDCRLFVFGEAGTTFELRESGEPREDAEALLPVEIAGS